MPFCKLIYGMTLVTTIVRNSSQSFHTLYPCETSAQCKHLVPNSTTFHPA